ncbi:alpha tubulin suppressor [Rhodotorula kratochvilovae]
MAASRRAHCSLYAAGSNSHGQLASAHRDDLARFTRIPLPEQLCPEDIACGANHSLLLAGDPHGQPHLFGAGSNTRGQLLPSPSTDLRLEFTQISLKELSDGLHLALPVHEYAVARIAACWETSLILLRPVDPTSIASDVLLSLGANDWGERGSASVAQGRASVVELGALVPDEDREATVLRIVDLQAGPRHALALVELSPVVSTSSSPSPLPRRILTGWGASRHGQLGPAPSSSSPPRATHTPQEVFLPPGYTGSDVVSFAAGRDHSAVLLRRAGSAEERVLLLGSGRHGQLGPPAGEAPPPKATRNALDPAALLPSAAGARVDAVHCTWSSTFLALSPPAPPHPPPFPPPPALLAFGLHSHGQLGVPAPPSSGIAHPRLPPGSSVRALAAGSEHVLALLDGADGAEEVWGWGWNEHGNLPLLREARGADKRKDVWAPRRVWEGEGRVVRVWAGMASSWILVEYDAEEREEG